VVVDPTAIHHPEVTPDSLEQYTPVLMKRGDQWDPNAPGFEDAMKQHHVFAEQMTAQGYIAVAGPFALSDQGELRGVDIFRVGAQRTATLLKDDPTVKAGLLKPELHPWLTGKGVLAPGQPMK
jgi:uncharacterized protein